MNYSLRMQHFITSHRTPVGFLKITATDDAITGVDFMKVPGKENDSHPMLTKAMNQLDEYFRGEREAFDLPLNPEGTAFQQKVWKAMSKIKHGKTLSYGQIAKIVGSPNASRAVGSACGKNPIVVVLPCHRVKASDGGLGGFSGGLDRKQLLLNLEQPAVLQAA